MSIKSAFSMLCAVVVAVAATQHHNHMKAVAAVNPSDDIGEIVMLPVKYNPPLGIYRAQNKKQLECLAKNIQEEAVRGNKNDMIAVAYGTINRVKSPRFPNTICKVVYQKNQMSWTRLARKKKRPVSKKYRDLAKRIMIGAIPNPKPSCDFTNWFNARLDSKKSYNYRRMIKNGACVHKPKDSPHFYLTDRW